MKTKKNNPNKETKLGIITILAEREVPFVELDMDIPDDIAHKLAQAGWQEIQHDRKALINYAFVKALEEFCDANGRP